MPNRLFTGLASVQGAILLAALALGGGVAGMEMALTAQQNEISALHQRLALLADTKHRLAQQFKQSQIETTTEADAPNFYPSDLPAHLLRNMFQQSVTNVFQEVGLNFSSIRAPAPTHERSIELEIIGEGEFEPILHLLARLNELRPNVIVNRIALARDAAAPRPDDAKIEISLHLVALVVEEVTNRAAD